MASRKKPPAPPPPPPALDPFAVFKRELAIAATVAASLTAVLLVRRWASALLGTGVFNSEIFAGNAVVTDLIAAVEHRFTVPIPQEADGTTAGGPRAGRQSAGANGRGGLAHDAEPDDGDGR